jgi:hypothetical protein
MTALVASLGRPAPAVRLSPAAIAGAPTTGAHEMGELMVYNTGTLFLCKATGTPGSWVRVALHRNRGEDVMAVRRVTSRGPGRGSSEERTKKDAVPAPHFTKDIRPLFHKRDVEQMESIAGFDLSRFEDVRRHAGRIAPCDRPDYDADFSFSSHKRGSRRRERNRGATHGGTKGVEKSWSRSASRGNRATAFRACRFQQANSRA